MCKKHHAVLHLLHVKKENMFVYPAGKNAGVSVLALKAEVARLDQLELQAQRIQKENNIDCFYHVTGGHFHNAVAEIAEDFYCDLIILEKARRSGIFSLFTGNNAYKILKHAKCPVLTIPFEKKYLNFKKILFPLRPDTVALEKLEIALPIIKRNKSRVLLFTPIRKNKTTSELENVHDHLMVKGNVKHEKQMNTSQDMALKL
jgi:nucleotide-binding universal stress UspA family protein